MKIVIADDHAVVRSGFEMILNFQQDMEVVATAADGIEAYQMVATHQPDILLMDLSMPPGESGLIATAKIAEDFPETKIVILTMYDEEEYLFHILKKGAKGYVLKNSPDEVLVSALRMVHEGGTYIHPEMATSLVREWVTHNEVTDETDPFQVLTTREIEILPLVAKGYGNKEIGQLLHISVKTVESYKARIMNKLNFKTRPELVEYALKKKLLEF